MQVNSEKIFFSKPSITNLEIGYVTDAISNGWGNKSYEYIDRFQIEFADYLGSNYALATSCCTGALHLALMALGIKAFDEVIVPDITWIASVEPILYIGAKPVFVDVLQDTWCIDPEKVEEAITSKTRAIIVVHLYGNLVEMDAIMHLANKYNLVVIEDGAEAIGSEYKSKKAGSIGHAGVFSFHSTKTMSTGEGGILVTDNCEVIKRARVLNDHGRNPAIGKMLWMEEYGYKYKMSNVQAAMGCAQIERIEELIKKKRLIFNWYKDLLRDLPVELNPENKGTKNSYWMPTVVVDEDIEFDPERLLIWLRENDIDSRPFFYPLSSLPMFKRENDNMVAYSLYKRSFNLPSYHDLSKESVEKVARCVSSFLMMNSNAAKESA
jgi:perosamine synthetase